MASLFREKIVSLKLAISSKLGGPPSPFAFNKSHTGQKLNDFTPVTPAEVTKLLNSMFSKSSPLDYVSTSLLKSCARTFSILISHLANLSFDQAAFPSKFKHALITPFLKNPGLFKSDPSNFRPISNLNTIGKILERLALARLLPHLSISPSLSPLRSAYRKFHSTETALLKLTNDIMDAIDSGKVRILVALDMSAAFDTLDHSTFLHRLEHTFGLSGTVHTWIHSYLTNRSSFVRIGWSSSSCDTSPELSTGRMDPRVGLGRVGSQFCRILAGRVSGRVSTSDLFSFFTDYFLVPESIGIFKYYIRINWFFTIFNI